MNWLLAIVLLLLLAQSKQTGQDSSIAQQQQIVSELQLQIETLHPDFINNFVQFYHLLPAESNRDILNITRVQFGNYAYLLLVAKMYLYQMIPNAEVPTLKYYMTDSPYIAAYYYLKIAADHYENREAYYLLGVMQQFKLVPDKVLESNIQEIKPLNKDRQTLLKYLQQSHLYNAESNFYMSSALGFDPASLILGYMNINRFGTGKNCTTALSYYLSVVKNTYVESYFFRQVYSFDDKLEDQLFARQRLPAPSRSQSSFVEQTDYFDEETIEATSYLADNYYMGRQGHVRNLTRALKLYQKLAQGGSSYGKLMAGICYYKGEGASPDRKKAQRYFQEVSTDSIAEYSLLAMKYFQILKPGTKPKALASMLQIYKSYKKQSKEKLSSQLLYLVGSSIIKGELKEKDKQGKDVVVPEADGIEMVDLAASYGNPMAKVLLGLLFADGHLGLKYGCEEATKYFQEEALVFPFVKNRISMAQVGLNRGMIAFSMIKYMELSLVGYQSAYINLLYIIEVYGKDVLKMNKLSWSIKSFAQNSIYQELHRKGIKNVESFILKRYTISKHSTLGVDSLDKLLIAGPQISKKLVSYIRMKVIRWGAVFNKKNILMYYEYLLNKEQGLNVLPVLTSLASGQNSKMYVSEARYLLGKYHHQKALKNKTTLTPQQHFRILSEYNRAVKSELLGPVIFYIEEYLMGQNISFQFFKSEVGEDILAYVFVISIGIFVLYYMRSKRIDHFNKNQLEKQLRKTAEQQEQQRLQQAEEDLAALKRQEERLAEEQRKKDEFDPNQPQIIEQPIRGVRIGSSLEEGDSG